MSNNLSDQEVFFPDGIKVKVAGREFSIKPFVLKNRQSVIKLFGDIFIEAALQSEGASIGSGALIKSVLAVAGDRMIEIYMLVLDGVDKDFLSNHMTMKDEVNVLKAIIEVNDFPFLISQVETLIGERKKILANKES